MKMQPYPADTLVDVIAIDGPAGAGKSTTARRVADVLGYAYLDTGAMYRAATWWALHQGVNLDDADAIAATVDVMPLALRTEGKTLRVWVGDHDVTEAIRSPEVTRVIYRVDQNPRVRERLVDLQRAFAENRPIVAEGRDMGTVVFPRARCKVFLDASLDERARRRAAELATKGVSVNADEVRREMNERDEKNRTRAIAPLRPAPEAVLLDTTGMTPEAVVEAIVRLAREVS